MNAKQAPTAPANAVVRRLTDISDDPKTGDRVENRKAASHQRRRVSDRYLGGDVEYVWDLKSNYYGRCTLDEWRAFCGKGARVMETAK